MEEQVTLFLAYLNVEMITKKKVIDYKVTLMKSSYKITTVNLNIIAVNKFIRHGAGKNGYWEVL